MTEPGLEAALDDDTDRTATGCGCLVCLASMAAVIGAAVYLIAHFTR